MRPSTRLIATLLFASGFAALVYQTAWQRMFQLVFGASTGASAAVLGVFLGGLGLGAWWLGGRAERSEQPLKLYGDLELGVALTAAATPGLVWGAQKAYLALGGSQTLGAGGAVGVRLLLAVMVMGPTVVLMGGTLPAAARAAESERDAARGRLATLYALNTIGAVAGALLGTFVLFELLGTRLSLWAAVLVNLLVAIVARGSGRRADAVPVERSGPVDAGGEVPATDTAPAPLVYAIAGVVGFVFLALEIVWYRMLAPILGGSTFTFGLVLAVALAGIGAGGYAYSRRDEDRPATLSLLAATLGLEALAVGVPIALGDSIAVVAAYTRPVAALGFGALLATWALLTAVVVLPAAVASGYQFPVLFALLGRGRRRVAQQVGRAYAANTAGSILGAVLAGFVLIPGLGAVATWRGAVVVLVVLAGVTAALGARRSASPNALRWGVGVACAVLALGTVFTRGPTSVWRHAPIGAGRIQLTRHGANALEAWMVRHRAGIVWERDGVESAVALDDAGGFAFVVGGKVDGSVLVDRGTQIWLALLPALLHPGPKSVFVVGLGTGMSAGWVARVPSVERVDVAELEPAIVDVAQAASAASHDVLAARAVDVLLGDGRELLATSDRRYDVIASEPSNPYRAGIASLFTRDFYRIVDDHLAEGGLFAQWVQGYEIDADTLRTVFATLRSVFPFVQAWQTDSSDLVLIAAREASVLDVAKLRQRLGTEPYRSALRRGWMVDDAEGVLSRFVASASLVARIAEAPGVPTNSDDVNVLEFSFARTAGRGELDIVRDLLSASLVAGEARPAVRGEVDWERVSELRPRGWLMSIGGALDLPVKTRAGKARSLAVHFGCRGPVPRSLEAWRAQDRAEPRDVVERFALGQGYGHAGDPRAVELAASLRAEGFAPEADLILARLHAARGRIPRAFEAALRAVDGVRHEPLTLCRVPEHVLDVLERLAGAEPGRAARAAEKLLPSPFAIHAANAIKVETQQRLAYRSRRADLCVTALGAQLAEPWWTYDFLALRADCLEAAGHPMAAEARHDLVVFRSRALGELAPRAPKLAPPDPPPLAVPKPSALAPPVDAGGGD